MDSHPAAVALAVEHETQLATSASCIADLRSFATQLVHGALPTAPASQTANSLLDFSLQGKDGWDNAIPLLRIVGATGDDIA